MQKLVFIISTVTSLAAFDAAADVEKWRQFRVEYVDSTWSGNPFDQDFVGVFTHTDTGRVLRQFGFYAGDNVWKIYFMPDQEGEWTFVTESTDTDLQRSGSFVCTPSTLKGKLVGSGNRWQYSNGESAFPIVTSSLAFLRGTTLDGGIRDFIDWLDATAGVNMLHPGQLFYFTTSDANIGGPDSLPFVVDEHPDNFNMVFWDRMNEHFDYLRDKNMGQYIMFYTDDGQKPDNGGILAGAGDTVGVEEERLFKYTVARFGAYPMVIWDSGIDIGEYRELPWIDNFVAWFHQNDPWDHPVASRSLGNSGGKHADAASYWSDGSSSMPAFGTFAGTWQSRSVPTLFTDRFREDGTRGNFDREGIRRAAWQCLLTGASGLIASGSTHAGYLVDDYATAVDFESAYELGMVRQFFENEVRTVESLSPDPTLASNQSYNWSSALTGREYVVYLRSGNDGGVLLDLSAGTLNVQWFDPTDGSKSSVTQVTGGAAVQFDTPGVNALGDNDWVLHVWSGVLDVPPAPPTNLVVQ